MEVAAAEAITHSNLYQVQITDSSETMALLEIQGSGFGVSQVEKHISKCFKEPHSKINI
jgi:hypothetical protein